MGLFDKIKQPVFLKESSTATTQLEALQALQGKVPENMAGQLAQDIRNLSAGIAGENAVAFELKNSHMPMFVLHDLMLTFGDLSAQIDYLLITRKCCFLVECKKLYGNVQINERGEFIRWLSFHGKTRPEGFYSPVTQNTRHLELIKQIQGSLTNIFTKGKFEKEFYERYRSVVVLANDKTVLNVQNAPEEIKSQVIRADQLVEYMKRMNDERNAELFSEKTMEETARFFLACHKEGGTDFVEKYRAAILQTVLATQATAPKAPAKAKSALPKEPKQRAIPQKGPSVPPVVSATQPETLCMEGEEKICPKCGAQMVLRVAKKGANAGQSFYGCSAYPKCRTIVNIE